MQSIIMIGIYRWFPFAGSRGRRYSTKKDGPPAKAYDIVDPHYGPIAQQFQYQQYLLIQIPELIQQVTGQDVTLMHHGIVGLRRIISACSQYTSQEMSQIDNLKMFVKLCNMVKYPQLVFEATWCIGTIVSSKNLDQDSFMAAGVVDILAALLGNQSSWKLLPLPIYRNLIMALGNLVVGNNRIRDYLIELKVPQTVTAIARYRQQDFSHQLMKQTCWFVSNLSRGDPLPPYQLIKQGLAYILKFFSKGDIQDVLIDCLYTIQYHVNLNNDNIQLMMEDNRYKLLFQILNNCTEKVKILIMRIMGNMTAGENQIIQILVEDGILEYISKFLGHTHRVIRLETMWTVTNIAASNFKETQLMMCYPNILDQIVDMMFNQTCNKVRKQVLYFFTNLSIHFATPQPYFRWMVDMDLPQFFCSMLQSDSSLIIEGTLSCLSTFLKKLTNYEYQQEQFNSFYAFLQIFDQFGGITMVQQLIDSEEKQIVQIKAQYIYNKYFKEYQGLKGFDIYAGKISDPGELSTSQQNQPKSPPSSDQ